MTFAREISRPEELWMGMDQDCGGSVQAVVRVTSAVRFSADTVPSEIREPTFPLCFKKRQVSGSAGSHSSALVEFR